MSEAEKMMKEANRFANLFGCLMFGAGVIVGVLLSGVAYGAWFWLLGSRM